LFASYPEDERVRDFMQTANPAVPRETADRFAEGIRAPTRIPRLDHAARKHKAARDKNYSKQDRREGARRNARTELIGMQIQSPE
jgi:hypothetical protein